MAEVESQQHPFTVVLADDSVVGGAATAADAVVLAAALFGRAGEFVSVTDGTQVIAQLGLERTEQTPATGLSLASINPVSQPSPLQVLTCLGSGFEEGAEILFDDVRQVTTFDDSTSVASRLNRSGIEGERCAVQVRNPDGETSNTLYFTFE
jgi:hypothetical protein